MPNSRPGGSAPPSAAAAGEPRDRVRCGLLLDFYGELLSPRQRDIEARTGLLCRHTETVARLKRLQATLLRLEEGCGADGAQRALARTALDELGAILEGSAPC